MTSTLKKICASVLRKITPSQKERKHVLALAQELKRKVSEAAEEAGVKAEVRVEGSVAKDTWLSGEPEIDIFMRVPKSMPREAFGTICLEIAKKATKGFRQVERFAEHPYLEAYVNSTRVNIVPCYRVRRGEWVSATDRTPFHTNYVKPLLNERLCGEIRLLKKFMKGIGVYGAEIKVGGFSGYLCEILTLNHDSFLNTLKSIAEWKEQRVIDYEGYYKEREDEAKKIFEEPLIVVDPVDKGRNAASAVRKESLDEFIAASRAFLKKPNLKFFYPREIKALNAKGLVQAIKNRESALIFVKFGRVEAVPDILWGQLYKSQRAVRKMLKQYDFKVIRDSAWSDEKSLNMLILEVEHRFLPTVKKHLGPPIRKRAECDKFLRKHHGSSNTISGPYIEDNRWVVEIKRKHADVVAPLLEKLKDGGRRVGVADLVSKAVSKSLKIFVNEEVLWIYKANPEFARFLTRHLVGKPIWLE